MKQNDHRPARRRQIAAGTKASEAMLQDADAAPLLPPHPRRAADPDRNAAADPAGADPRRRAGDGRARRQPQDRRKAVAAAEPLYPGRRHRLRRDLRPARRRTAVRDHPHDGEFLGIVGFSFAMGAISRARLLAGRAALGQGPHERGGQGAARGGSSPPGCYPGDPGAGAADQCRLDQRADKAGFENTGEE